MGVFIRFSLDTSDDFTVNPPLGIELRFFRIEFSFSISSISLAPMAGGWPISGWPIVGRLISGWLISGWLIAG